MQHQTVQIPNGPDTALEVVVEQTEQDLRRIRHTVHTGTGMAEHTPIGTGQHLPGGRRQALQTAGCIIADHAGSMTASPDNRVSGAPAPCQAGGGHRDLRQDVTGRRLRVSPHVRNPVTPTTRPPSYTTAMRSQ
ncbi:hypothetical protein GCM10010440_71140 [Kitasatospora cinereorecta]